MRDARRDPEDDAPGPQPAQVAFRFVSLTFGAIVLYLARDVLVPLAISILLAFALSPLVTRVRRSGLSVLWSVLAVVTLAGAVLGLFAYLVTVQLAQLAANLPSFRQNIIAKVEGLKDAGQGGGLFRQLSDMASTIGAQIDSLRPADSGTPPLQVEMVTHTTAWDLVSGLALPLAGPLGTAGIVVILVIFMLLEREDLRERFIRLLGPGDVHRTTQVLEEAGARVGTYLLTQLLVNLIYAVPITLGLWLIGIPQALLWGLLTLVLRFVPYIGSMISAFFPLALAFAASPGWGPLLWVAGLYVAVEFLTSNIIEPWAYGSRTGVSPLAIIISALFWTFLWGPLGLVLSTPMTVCLVVLGRHLPQFDIFDILFGDTPVLAPHARLYQRLLSGDRTEATFRAEEALEDEDILEFYQTSAIPTLLLAQQDRDRGLLTPERERRLAATALAVLADLDAALEDGAPAGDAPDPDQAAAPARIAVVGGRWDADDVSAEILARALNSDGDCAVARKARDLSPGTMRAQVLDGHDCVILCFLDPTPSRASLLHVSRLKRARPGLRVGVVIWEMPADLRGAPGSLTRITAVPEAKLDEALELGADFAVRGLEEACTAALSEAEAAKQPPPQPPRRKPARSPRPKSPAPQAQS